MRFKEFVVRVECPADLDITQRDIVNELEDFCKVNNCTVEGKKTPQITDEQLNGMAIYNACAEGYDENTEDENMKKAEIYRKKSLRQLKDREIFEDYQREYSCKTGETPSFVIFFSERLCKPVLSLPSYIRLSADSWTRIPLAIDGAVCEKYADSDMFISYHFVNGMGVPVLNSPEIPIQKGDKRLMLPVRSPKAESRCTSLVVKVILRSEGRQESIQKSTQLSLVTSDEVNYV